MSDGAGRRSSTRMTVDVEDYFQASAFDRVVSRATWDAAGEPRRPPTRSGCWRCSTASACTRRSSFSAGWRSGFRRWCARLPRAATRSRRTASHHRLVYTLTPDQFREDVRRAKDAARRHRPAAPCAATARPASRSPRESLWALDVLIEEGHTLRRQHLPDSSRSLRHSRRAAPRARHRARHRLDRRSAGVDRAHAAAPTCRSPAADISGCCRTGGRDGASRA